MIHSRSSHTTLNIETGTNVFDKAQVIAACDRVLLSIKTAREEEKETKIQKYMRSTWYSNGSTREEAVQMCSGGQYSKFGAIDRKYLSQERIASRVKRISMSSVGDTVNLTAKEFLEIEPL